MSKKHKKIDVNQLTIFDFLSRAKSEMETVREDTPGKFSCVDALRDALKAAIKNSPLSIHQIAGEMSHLLNETVTAEIIYSWTRRSDEVNGRAGRHIPAQYLPAFCQVTGDNSTLVIMGELVGLFVLPGKEALRAEIQKIEEKIRDAKAAKRKRQVLLNELNQIQGE